MFAGIYRDFAGKLECGDCMYTRNPCNFWSKSKKVWTFYIYTLLRFFKFPYNFCGDFRRTLNPRDNYMHFTGYVLRHRDIPRTFYGGKICSVVKSLLCYTYTVAEDVYSPPPDRMVNSTIMNWRDFSSKNWNRKKAIQSILPIYNLRGQGKEEFLFW